MENRIRLTTRLAADSKAKPKKKDGLQREIPEDAKYDASKLKHLKKILHNINIAVGNLTGASKEFSLLKGPDISPDGMLGGKGYIKTVREIKEALATSVHTLADVGDTLVDELNNPKWGIKDKELEKVEKEKAEIDEQAEEIDDNLGEETEGAPEETEEEPTEEKPEETIPKKDEQAEQDPPQLPEDPLQKESADISSSDIHDSASVSQEKDAADVSESMNRYLASLETDKTKNILSKHILAKLIGR